MVRLRNLPPVVARSLGRGCPRREVVCWLRRGAGGRRVRRCRRVGLRRDTLVFHFLFRLIDIVTER